MWKKNKIRVPNDVKLLESFWEKHLGGLKRSKWDEAKFMASAFEMFNYCMRGDYLVFFDRQIWGSKLRKD